MAAAEGRSRTKLIRDALQAYTNGAKRPGPRGLGKYDSGETNSAEHAKDFLRAAATKGRWRR